MSAYNFRRCTMCGALVNRSLSACDKCGTVFHAVNTSFPVPPEDTDWRRLKALRVPVVLMVKRVDYRPEPSTLAVNLDS